MVGSPIPEGREKFFLFKGRQINKSKKNFVREHQSNKKEGEVKKFFAGHQNNKSKYNK